MITRTRTAVTMGAVLRSSPALALNWCCSGLLVGPPLGGLASFRSESAPIPAKSNFWFQEAL
jgi:hypothetical protein